MPRLHRAKTVAWGLLKWGMCAWMVCVHSVTRGWQDIRFLLGCMGYIATHTTPAGRHVLPLCLAGRNIIDSKTYPRKGRDDPAAEVAGGGLLPLHRIAQEVAVSPLHYAEAAGGHARAQRQDRRLVAQVSSRPGRLLGRGQGPGGWRGIGVLFGEIRGESPDL